MDDNKQVEPKYYAPVIPMVLVNGAAGIGTGWSTTIPQFNPLELIEYLKNALQNGHLNEQHDKLTPFYRGHTGTIENFENQGAFHWNSDDTLEITDLPVGEWTENYIERLTLLEKAGAIENFISKHTDTTVNFEVIFKNRTDIQAMKKVDTFKLFKLRRKMNYYNNWWLFDHNGVIQNYKSAEDLIEKWLPVRLEMYEKRKTHILHLLTTL